MTALLDFPVASPAPEPVIEEITLYADGNAYTFWPWELEAHLRYTKDQLVAIQAMRASGIADDVIEQAFPRKVAIVPGTKIPGTIPEAQVAAAPEVFSPPPVAAAPSDDMHPRRRANCEHNRQSEADGQGNIRCAKCDKIIIRGAGFVDNTNRSWNGMSRNGAAAFDPRVRQLATGHFEPAYRGELA